MIKLSILVCTVPSRVDSSLPLLIKELAAQATDEVEVLYLGDNKQRTVGAKRNDLMKLAQGEYICYVDDDDMVREGYVRQILRAMEKNPDLIVFEAFRHHNGYKDRKVKYSMSFPKDRNLQGHYERVPNHLMVWKRKIALAFPFEELNYGEDGDWARRIKESGLVKVQTKIPRILYDYWFDVEGTETQQFLRGE